ncbi:MAG: ribosomal protein S18-alanine N-acetyltransferase [Colwellia sp.]|nr:ribosomal protein S18-alanine N-acetyltransferase [Colwellia sp.]
MSKNTNNTSNNNRFIEITPDDVKDLMVIECACHSHPWSEKTFTSCIGGRYFGEKLRDKTIATGFYIGEYVIGEATLMDICVTPNQQGKGLGKVLLKQFLVQAKKLGATKIFLEVRAKNIPAQMLYMNAGFIEIDRRTGYYPSSSGFGYEDAIVMSLSC